jgi:integrase
MNQIDYWIIKPNKTRKSFAIVERSNRSGGARIKDSRLDAINKAFKANAIDFITALYQVTQIKIELESKNNLSTYPSCDANIDLFNKYWDTKYSRRKTHAESKRSARGYYLRAIAALGATPLLSTSIQDLQKIVDTLPNKKQRSVTNCLNRLLKFYGRSEVLAKAKKEDSEFRYLDEKDFKLMLRHVWPHEQKLICNVAFYSGLRLGEIFAVRQFFNEDSTLHVEKQMYEDGSMGTTKNRKKRRVFVAPTGVEHVDKLLELETSDRQKLRKLSWAKIVKRACKEAFPKSPEKHLNFHDLRHSYAIYCMSKGLSLTVVASCLGDGLAVAQEYYARFERTSDLGQLAKRLWKAS